MSILDVAWKTFQVYFQPPPLAARIGPIQYPPTQRLADISYYKSAAHGRVAVANPYSWLESDSTERDDWVIAQNQFTGDHLERYTDRDKLTTVLERSFNYTIFDPPRFGAQGRWYWMAQTGTQEQPVLYRSEGADLPFAGDDGKVDLEANAEIYFDVNLLSPEFLSLSSWTFSPNEAYFAYSVSHCESDMQEIYIRRTSPFNRDHPEQKVMDYIQHSAFGSIVWDNSSTGIFYVHEPSDYSGVPLSHAKLLYHKLGTNEKDDLTVLVGEDPNAMFRLSQSSDGKYLLLSITKGIKDRNMLWIAEMASFKYGDVVTWIKLKDKLEAIYEYISNDGPTFYFFTNEGSDRYYVVKVDVDSCSELEHQLVPILSDTRNVFLRQYEVIGSNLAVAVYSHNVKDELYILLKGRAPERLEADFIGTITVHPMDKGFLANFVSYTTPGYMKRFILGDDNSTYWRLWRNTHFDALPLSEFITQQVWYNSTDGTPVPMFIVRHQSTALDGTAPCLQYAYGAFGVSVTPFFSPSFLTFVHTYGGILAVPNVRGGSEFGSTWKTAGSKRNKKNTIADFIAARKFLVREKYAAPAKVAIIGWSGGGELMSESVQRAPEGTFGAAVVNRGAHDLLRFSLFPPGKYWLSDVGDPFKPKDFDFIHPISPQHNVPVNKVLPPTLVTAGQRDQRVLPLFSYKYAATLQYLADPRSAVQLFLAIENAGHSEDSSSHAIRIREAVASIGFVAQSLGLHLI